MTVTVTIVFMIVLLSLLNDMCNSADVACEDVCNCYHRRIGMNNDKKFYIIDCSNLGLDTFPSDFPLTSTHILLNGNNFDIVGTGSNTFGVTGRILPNIREIYLHNNPITSIDANTFDNCRRAHTLLLHHTSLTTIPSGLLINMVYLKYFWINDALLTSIPSGSFDGLPKLSEVYLYGNDLSTLDVGLFKDSPNLKEILVHQNPSLESPTCCNLCGVPEKTYIRWGNEKDATKLECGCSGTTTCADCTYSSCTTYTFSAASSFIKYSYIIATISAFTSVIILM